MKRGSRDLETLFTDGSVGGLSDSACLERFAAGRDEEAFEALVVRHGPMVWGVCRRILRDPNDAEDAFQATFLVLARKASTIARREMVANWLYAVAYRTAVRAGAMASRRRRREQHVAEMPEPEARPGERRDDLLSLLDQELTYGSNGVIVRRPVDYSLDAALSRARVRPLDPPDLRQRMTGLGRTVETPKVRSSEEIVNLDGRRVLHSEWSERDSQGRWRLSGQSWYDLETRRPIQYRERLDANEQSRYDREYGTTTITYVDRGPADIQALGVPAETPIVDQTPQVLVVPPIDGPELPPRFQEALNVATRAIERFPRSVRVVEQEDYRVDVTYWSAPRGYLEATAANLRDRNLAGSVEGEAPRSFHADHQGSYDAELPERLRSRPGDDLPADALAKWLPVDRSVNVDFNDGAKGYRLNRSYVGRGKPRKVQVYVHRADGRTTAPEWLKELWPFLFEMPRIPEVVPPASSSSRGRVAMKFAYPQGETLYEADPEHGHAVARKVQWLTLDDENRRTKYREESNALRWARLPGGVWYVTAWEKRIHRDDFDRSGKPRAEPSPDTISVRRVNITSMDPATFPPGILDGEAFLDGARKEGAKILVE